MSTTLFSDLLRSTKSHDRLTSEECEQKTTKGQRSHSLFPLVGFLGFIWQCPHVMAKCFHLVSYKMHLCFLFSIKCIVIKSI